MQQDSSAVEGRFAWPAAKYLSYAFWRAWFLIVASAPLWQAFVPSGGVRMGLDVYVASTVLFVAASFLLSFFHTATARLLASKTAVAAFGVLGSLGAFGTFGGIAFPALGSPLLALASSAVAGAFTAPLAIRAGQVYASTRHANTAVICTLLSDVAAGLVFYFCAGSWPAVSLAVISALPLLSAVAGLVASPVSGDEEDAGDVTADAERAAHLSFGRFVVVFFLIGMATFTFNDLGESWLPAQDVTDGRMLGISLLVIASFALAVAYSAVPRLSFMRLYRPIVVFLLAFMALSFGLNVGDVYGVAGIFLCYCLFSSYIWCFLSYLARSRYFTPIQVFGTGRAVYSLGSLVACVLGILVDGAMPSLMEENQLAIVAVACIVLLLCVVAVRQSDIADLLSEAAGSGRALKEDPQGALSAKASAADARTRGMGEGSAESSSADALLPAADRGTDALSQLPASLPEGVRLTPREREVYALLLMGRDSGYIAESLCISRNTAKTHVKNIYAKFGVNRRQDFIDVVQNLKNA